MDVTEVERCRLSKSDQVWFRKKGAQAGGKSDDWSLFLLEKKAEAVV